MRRSRAAIDRHLLSAVREACHDGPVVVGLPPHVGKIDSGSAQGEAFLTVLWCSPVVSQCFSNACLWTCYLPTMYTQMRCGPLDFIFIAKRRTATGPQPRCGVETEHQHLVSSRHGATARSSAAAARQMRSAVRGYLCPASRPMICPHARQRACAQRACIVREEWYIFQRACVIRTMYCAVHEFYRAVPSQRPRLRRL